jgi:hypothetical protein
LIKDLHPAVQVSPLLTAPPELQPQASAECPLGADAAGSSRLRHSSYSRVRCYSSQFADLMEMRAPAAVVGAYLDRHEGWFRRCAAPMRVNPLSRNGYALTLGRFGNFGFEVEPTIGLELLPQCKGVYRILTVPGAASPMGTLDEQLYDVEFNAALELEQEPQVQTGTETAFTEVRWQLDLSVWIKLPGVITLLPEGLVQSSGEHLLRQIVRQISRRLTWKVQEDFHASHGLECPPRRRAQF